MSRDPGPTARAIRAVLPNHGETVTRAELVADVAGQSATLTRNQIVLGIRNMTWDRTSAARYAKHPVLIRVSADLFEVFDPDAARWTPDTEEDR